MVLKISAKLAPDHYLYSTNKAQGAATRISFTREEGLEPIDEEFIADHEPKKVFDPDLKEDIEKFYDKVTWSRRFKLKAGAENVSVAGLVRYQVCNSSTCRLLKYPFDVKLSSGTDTAEAEPAATSRTERPRPAKAAQPVATDDSTTRFEQMVPEKGGKAVGGTWTVSVEPVPGEEGDVTIVVRAQLRAPWHVYPLDQPNSEEGGSLPTVIGLEETAGLVALDPAFSGPRPTEALDPNEPSKIQRYHQGSIEWKRRYRIEASDGAIRLAGRVAWQTCNENSCLLATGFEFEGELEPGPTDAPELLTITKTLSTAEASEAIEALSLVKATVALSEPSAPAAPSRAAPAAAPAARGTPDQQTKQNLLANQFNVRDGQTDSASRDALSSYRSQGLPLFLLAAALAGFAALLTPCVFPMIPITVSFFQKQSEKQHHRPMTMALVYCLGIIGTFTGLGMLMSVIFSAAAITQLANNVVLNLVLAGVLIFFGFNLLGLFEIRMPSWLLTYTAGKESRGGFVGVLFMSLTFTLTSFTCTFAFAGLLLVAAQKGDRLWPILGLLAFSAAFSLPFFFLALFPSFLQKLPKSGGWMNVVKVIMGLIELGAAFKFFGVADQAWNGQAAIFDFHLMVSAWAVISLAAALYLLGMFRLSHDTPTDHIGVLRFVSAMSFMGLAAYLSVGLFSSEKPQGMVWKYVEAFATPTFEGGTDPTGPYLKHGELKYALDFERAFEFAVSENKPLFLDFTGVNCTNCRFMEQGHKSIPAIEEKLSRFVRVQLFTDIVPLRDNEVEARRLRDANVRLQEEWFGDVTLPSYVVIPPDPAVLKNPQQLVSLKGKNDESEFARFLDAGWKQFQASKSGRVLGQR